MYQHTNVMWKRMTVYFIGIRLLTIRMKVYGREIIVRMVLITENQSREEQRRFQRDRGVVEMVFTMRIFGTIF